MTQDAANWTPGARTIAALNSVWRRVRLVVIQPPGYPHTAAFRELIECLFHAFAALGATVDAAENAFIGEEGVNIIFGAHLVPFTPELPQLPGNCIIYNLEQLTGGSIPEKRQYIDLLKAHSIFDYSQKNIDAINEIAGHDRIYRLRMGYMPQMNRIPKASAMDVDVLFYGSMNQRRWAVLNQIERSGLTVKSLFGLYGPARDEWIARSKVVINIHAYDDKIHELVRSSYLLANRKVVLCECDGETEIEDDIRAAIVASPYDRLAETCQRLIRNESELEAIADRSFLIFRQRDQVDYVRSAIGAASGACPASGR